MGRSFLFERYQLAGKKCCFFLLSSTIDRTHMTMAWSLCLRWLIFSCHGSSQHPTEGRTNHTLYVNIAAIACIQTRKRKKLIAVIYACRKFERQFWFCRLLIGCSSRSCSCKYFTEEHLKSTEIQIKLKMFNIQSEWTERCWTSNLIGEHKMCSILTGHVLLC